MTLKIRVHFIRKTITSMKFRIKVSIMAFTVLLLNSCKQEIATAQPYPSTSNIVKLTDNSMPVVEFFSIVKVKLPDEYADAGYYVYADSVAIIINTKHPQPYMVTFYNLNTKKEIAGYFKKGNGPNELISVAGKLCCNYIIVRDGSSHSISRLDIDSVLIKKEAYKPTVVRLADFTIDGTYIGNNLITFPNPMYINNGYGIDGIPEFVQYDAKTGKPISNYKRNDKNFPTNLTQRTIAYCNSKYVAFWYNFPIITIYDKNFNLIKMYRDDKFKDSKIVKIEDSELLPDGFNDFFFLGCQTNNYIFTTNGRGRMEMSEVEKKGGFKWLSTPDFNIARFKNQEIWCFDTNINLVRRLKCSNTISFISCISYNEKTKQLYITAADENDENALYKCIFEKQ